MASDFSYDYNIIYKRALIIFKALAIAMNIALIGLSYLLLIQSYDTPSIGETNLKIFRNLFIVFIIILKIQLLTKVIGIYAVIKDHKNLIKFIGSGLMVGFAFINMVQMFNITLYYEAIIIAIKSKAYANSVRYIFLVLIIFQLILYSFCHNINTITKSLYLSLERKFKLALMATQGLIIILNIVLQSLLYVLINELIKDNTESIDKILTIVSLVVLNVQSLSQCIGFFGTFKNIGKLLIITGSISAGCALANCYLINFWCLDNFAQTLKSMQFSDSIVYLFVCNIITSFAIFSLTFIVRKSVREER